MKKTALFIWLALIFTSHVPAMAKNFLDGFDGSFSQPPRLPNPLVRQRHFRFPSQALRPSLRADLRSAISAPSLRIERIITSPRELTLLIQELRSLRNPNHLNHLNINVEIPNLTPEQASEWKLLLAELFQASIRFSKIETLSFDLSNLTLIVDDNIVHEIYLLIINNRELKNIRLLLQGNHLLTPHSTAYLREAVGQLTHLTSLELKVLDISANLENVQQSMPIRERRNAMSE